MPTFSVIRKPSSNFFSENIFFSPFIILILENLGIIVLIVTIKPNCKTFPPIPTKMSAKNMGATINKLSLKIKTAKFSIPALVNSSKLKCITKLNSPLTRFARYGNSQKMTPNPNSRARKPMTS